MRQQIKADAGAAPRGPYSQGIVCEGKQLYVAGQIPVDPNTGDIVGSNFEEQAVRTLENVKAIVEAAGATLNDVVKVNVYLSDTGFFQELNEIYQRYFSAPHPARTTIAASLPGVMIEIDCIAVLPG